MAKKPTKSQQEAIDFREKSLLVSASAGSGKTSTMISRMASLIKEGTKITEILALTFTKAAAAEMRERLFSALVDEAQNDETIRQQLSDFPLANISTVHSFCAELLRSNFAEAGVDPSFVLIEEMEKKVLFQSSLDETLEIFYTENAPEFYEILDAFGKKRSDRGLKKMIEKVYDCAINTENPDKWLDTAADFYDQKALKKLEEKINNEYVRTAEFFAETISKLVPLCHTEEMRAFREALLDAHGQIALILATNPMEKNYNIVMDFCAVKLPQIRTKCPEPELARKVKSVCDHLKKEMGKFQTQFAGISYNDLLREREAAAPYARTLASMTKRLKTIYEQKKSQLSALDFSDLEHITNRLLCDSKVQGEIASRFKYVFVDEYQDVNELQESIIKKLSRKDNLFLVGDIKQSIYAFRHSEPDIIKARMNEFSDGEGGKRINLSQNFRSHPDILDFVNLVFSSLMTNRFGGIDYGDGHSLNYESTDNRRECDKRVEVDFITGCKSNRLSFDDTYPMPYTVKFSQAGDRLTHAEAEAIVIANKIASLLEKGLEYKDIVVLTRSQTKHAREIFAKLTALGVPVSFPAEKMEGGTETLEIVISFMSLVNNHLQDIPLVAVLNSFMYNFCADELVKISKTRLGDCEGSACKSTDSKGGNCDADPDFFDKLCAFAEKGEGKTAEKSRQFLSELSRYRQLSKSISATELMVKIINEKSVEKFIRQNSGEQEANMLYNFVAALSQSVYAASLESFCEYIELYGIDKVYAGSDEGNSVAMLSVHKSKGLEYPAVIFAGLSQTEVTDKDEALVDKTSGISTRTYDTAARKKNKTLNYVAAKIDSTNRAKEEALRILYVALTRAKQYLYITACIDEFPEADEFSLTPYALSEMTSYAEMLATIIASTGGAAAPNGEGKGEQCFCVTKTPKSEIERLAEPETLPMFPIKDERKIAKIKKRLDFVYPYKNATTLRYKMAASEAANLIYNKKGTAKQPDAVSVKKMPVQSPAPQSATPVATPSIETGTLYHKVLLHLDLSCTDILGGLRSLLADGIITEEELHSIDATLVKNLFATDILQRAAKNKHFKEQPFMMLVPACEIDPTQRAEDEVIVQGIIDLMFFEGEDAIIVDYKYSSLPPERLRQQYAAQLKIYARAAETVLNRRVKGKFILSLVDAKVIEV